MGMLAGKVVAITGAGRGVGREIALLAARHGAAVVVNDPGVGGGGEGGDAGPAQQTADDIIAAGGQAHANLAEWNRRGPVVLDERGHLDAALRRLLHGLDLKGERRVVAVFLFRREQHVLLGATARENSRGKHGEDEASHASMVS